MTTSPSLLIMDNDRLALKLLSISLARLLPRFVMLPPVEHGTQAVAICSSHRCPDFLLADVSMSDINGLLVCQAIRKVNWKTSILMMTSFSVDDYSGQAAAYGAQGIIHKDDPRVIVSSLLEIMKHGICGAPFENAHDAFLRLKSDKGHSLSAREIQVVDRWSRGESMQCIAQALSISQTTVRTHLDHAAEKLGAATNRALIAAWLQLNR